MKDSILDIFIISNDFKRVLLCFTKFFSGIKIENKLNYFVKLVNINYLESSKYLDLIRVFNLVSSLKFSYFVDMIALDLLGDFIKFYGRFRIRYLLVSIKYLKRFILDINWYKDKWLFSIELIYKAASWSEREIWDLFGIFFFLNKDLRRLLTDYGFAGFPFRRDFPVVGFKELEFNHELFELLYIPVSLSQENRVFDYDSSWIKKSQNKWFSLLEEENI